VTPWEKYCESIGTTPEQHQIRCCSGVDLVDQPSDDPVVIGESTLHGFGVFCTRDVAPYMAIARALDRHMCRTRIVGRWINHSDTPNCTLTPGIGGTFLLCAKGRVIPRAEELLIDYREVDQIRARLTEAERTGCHWRPYPPPVGAR
jgi:hypothetical protein